MCKRVAQAPLFWRVTATNAIVLVVATLLLALAPVTVSAPVALAEIVILAAGLGAMVALNAVLIRPAFRPLHALAMAMRGVDPLEPTRRVPVVGGPDVASVARSFNEMLDRLESERRESARQALTVQESERQRIARELHDEVGQTLTAMMLQIEALAPRICDGLSDELEELRETARLGAEDLRRIAARLRPEALEELGLSSALSSLAGSFAEHSGIRMERRLHAVGQMTAEQELVIYRVAQEALTNIARHARAGRVELTLGREDGAVVLSVRDDGRGLPAGALSSSTGIRGMRERAMLIGARLSIGAAEGGGTEVTLRVPVSG